MSIRKLLFVTSLAAIALFSPLALANAAPSNNPVFSTVEKVQQLINAAVEPLIERVGVLERRPASSKEINVYDNDDHLLGILVRDDGGGSADVFFAAYNRILHLRGGNPTINAAGYFESTDCTGPTFTDPSEVSQGIANNILNSRTKFYILARDACPSKYHSWLI
jgi:hypothetical protein